MTDVRETLERLIRDRGEDYASLSRLLGRNAAYIQQFIRRGVPRRLAEDDRRLLARYLRVEEAELGGPPPTAPLRRARGMVAVNRLELGASAGPGALVDDESGQTQIEFEERWLRSVASSPGAVSLIRVMGDSMAPGLLDDDEIMVDRGDAADRLRDGIYVLRLDDVLMVKRLAINPVTRRVSIRSDNPAYPAWEDCDPATVDIIGRVVWISRKLR